MRRSAVSCFFCYWCRPATSAPRAWQPPASGRRCVIRVEFWSANPGPDPRTRKWCSRLFSGRYFLSRRLSSRDPCLSQLYAPFATKPPFSGRPSGPFILCHRTAPMYCNPQIIRPVPSRYLFLCDLNCANSLSLSLHTLYSTYIYVRLY